jgi:hypothetical protein
MATAVEVAEAVKEFIDQQWGNPAHPGVFDRLSGLILTRDEAIRRHADLYWTSDTLALSMVMEGMTGWPDEVSVVLEDQFPEWDLRPINNYTMGIFMRL